MQSAQSVLVSFTFYDMELYYVFWGLCSAGDFAQLVSRQRMVNRGTQSETQANTAVCGDHRNNMTFYNNSISMVVAQG